MEPAVGADVADGSQGRRREDGLQQGVRDVADLPDLAVEGGVRAVEEVAVAVRGLAFGGFGVAEALVDPFFVGVGLLLAGTDGGGVRVRVAGGDLEHEGLVDAVLGVGAGVETEADEGVAPGAGPEHVADVLEGLFEGEGVFFAADVVGDGAAGPDGAGGEEVAELGDGALEGRVEGFDGGEMAWWGGGGGADVVGDEVRGDFGRGLRVGCCEVAGGVDGLLDGGVLAVAGGFELVRS